MSTDRPSGFRMLQPPRDAIVLAVRRNYKECDVLEAIHGALTLGGHSVRVSEHPRDLFPTPRLLAVLDGWAQMPALKAIVTLHELLPQVPALAIITDHRGSVAELLKAGYQDCIVWPVPLAELLTQFEDALRAAQEEGSASIVVDPVRLTVECNAVHVTLTRTEFKLMYELLKAHDRWSSSKSLREGAAGHERPGMKPVAEHIHAIRRKLQHEAWRLRGHRSLGYFFDASQGDETRAFLGKKK